MSGAFLLFLTSCGCKCKHFENLQRIWFNWPSGAGDRGGRVEDVPEGRAAGELPKFLFSRLSSLTPCQHRYLLASSTSLQIVSNDISNGLIFYPLPMNETLMFEYCFQATALNRKPRGAALCCQYAYVIL